MNVTIIGAGKVGSVLGKVLVKHGDAISCVVSRSYESARRAGRYLHCPNFSTSVASIPRDTDLIFISTPHGEVGSVARQLARLDHLNFSRVAVCHASGMLTARVLDPVRRRGATVFSFHPLQTFPRDFRPRDIVESARGIYYGVDGSTDGLRVAKRLARALGGKTIRIPPNLRPFYHAACVVASNHLTAMMWILEQMFRRLHVKNTGFYPVFKPIIMATLKNIEGSSPAHALSGPVARGGVGTVAQHCTTVRRNAPDLLPYFVRLTFETVRLASKKGSIDKAQARALIDVIQSQALPPSLIQELH